MSRAIFTIPHTNLFHGRNMLVATVKAQLAVCVLGSVEAMYHHVLLVQLAELVLELTF